MMATLRPLFELDFMKITRGSSEPASISSENSHLGVTSLATYGANRFVKRGPLVIDYRGQTGSFNPMGTSSYLQPCLARRFQQYHFIKWWTQDG